jgi:hypothetical protein
MKEIICDTCGNREVFVLKIEYWEQHCSPEKYGQRWIRDSCLANVIGDESAELIINRLLKARLPKERSDNARY